MLKMHFPLNFDGGKKHWEDGSGNERQAGREEATRKGWDEQIHEFFVRRHFSLTAFTPFFFFFFFFFF